MEIRLPAHISKQLKGRDLILPRISIGPQGIYRSQTFTEFLGKKATMRVKPGDIVEISCRLYRITNNRRLHKLSRPEMNAITELLQEKR